jgi:hypothetical protein
MAKITLENLKTYLDNDGSEDTMLSLLLNQAENKVLNKRYPFGYTDEQKIAALEKYSDIVLDIAVYLYNKRGAEGQTGHSENGINRSYEKAGIPDSFVVDIVPVAKSRTTYVVDGDVL